MSTEKMREEFEAAFVKREHGLGRHPRLRRMATGNYEYVDTSAAWWAWQASRDAVAVKMPDPDLDRSTYSLGFNACLIKCRQAVKFQGLKVAS